MSTMFYDAEIPEADEYPTLGSKGGLPPRCVEEGFIEVGEYTLMQAQDEVLESLKVTHAEFLDSIRSELQSWAMGQKVSRMRAGGIASLRKGPSCISNGHCSSGSSAGQWRPQSREGTVQPRIDVPMRSKLSEKSVARSVANFKSTFLTSTSMTPSQGSHYHQKQRQESSSSNCVKRFVKSTMFDKVSALLVMSNGAFIGVQVECMFLPVIPNWITFIDYAFSLAFLVELILRLYSHGLSFWCDRADRGWNLFDFIVVLLTLTDSGMTIVFSSSSLVLGNVSILRILRIVRISRVLRIIRMLKFFKDLRILIAAIGSTMKTASFAIMLLLVIMYVFAITITQFIAQYLQESDVDYPRDLHHYFGSVWRSVFTLFMTTTQGVQWADVIVLLYPVDSMAVMVYVVFVALMNLCVLNVLTGIFCQSAIETASLDRDNVIQWQLAEKQRYITTLSELFQDFDEAYDGTCTYETFKQRLNDDRLQALLRSLDIEVRDALALFEMLDLEGNGAVPLEDFISSCITLRGGAKAVHMEKMQRNYNKIEARLYEIDEKLTPLKQKAFSARRGVSFLSGSKTLGSESTPGHRPGDENTKPPAKGASDLFHTVWNPPAVPRMSEFPRPPTVMCEPACLPNEVYEKPIVASLTLFSEEEV